MADFYLAPALVRLREEINFTHPQRDKTSDGWIGDTSHAARVSDHNPDWNAGGIVRATDTDKDGILPADLLAVAIVDSRVEYVIWDGFIYLRSTGFRKQVYTGTNKHTGHVHISLRHDKDLCASTRNWGYADRVLSRLAPPPPPAPSTPDRKSVDVIALEVLAGAWGNNPERSRRLQAAGYSPTEVQAAVNAKLGTPSGSAVVRPNNSVIADQVINGQWGSGPERRRRLIAAGYDADAVQAEVNRKLR